MTDQSESPAGLRQHVIETLQQEGQTLASKKVTAGFDGFVDTILRVIRTKEDHQSPILFKEVREFGEYIVERAGKSFGLELEEIITKLGGNMPLMSDAMAHLGVSVDCLGTLGFQTIHPVFKRIHSNCRLHSFANPGLTTALEFNDGKILLAQMESLNAAGWDTMKETVGIETLLQIYRQSDLLCLVNWSESDQASDIWQGILREVLPQCQFTRPPVAFFDLADFSKRSPQSIREALQLIEKFSAFCRVVLSLNKNETQQVYQLLGGEDQSDSLEAMGDFLSGKLAIDTLLVHTAKQALAWDNVGQYQQSTFFVEKPKISTGAGDNFNAGFCMGQLLEMSPDASLLLANAVSGFYVSSGNSPSVANMLGYLREKE